MYAVERVHARRMRGEEGRTNVCGREGVWEKDEGEEGRTNVCSREGAWEKGEGGGGEDKCLRYRGCMGEG